MADRDKLKKETLSVLSSLVISSAKGLTVRRLRKDYQDEMGEDVPYKNLGFLSFDQFLYSIPETCRLVGSGDNATVLPVITNKTKHINDMIMKQRPPKSRSNYRQPKRNRGVYANNIEPVKRQFNLPMIIPPCNPDSCKKVLPPPPEYYYEQRNKNRRYLPPRMFDNGIGEHSASNTDRNHYSNDFGNNIASTSKYNPPRMLNKQSRVSSFSAFSNNIDNRSASTSNYNPPSMANKHLANSFCDEEKSYDAVTCDNSLRDISTYTNPQLNTSHNHSHLNDTYDEYHDELNFSNDEDFESDFSYHSDNEENDLADSALNLLKITAGPEEIHLEEIIESRVNDRVKEKLRILISEHPDGIWCSKLVKLYNDRFKQKLDPLDYGFSSVIQLCDDVRDVFHCIRPNRTDWKLFDKLKPVPDIHTTQEFSKYLLTLPVETACSNTEPALPENYIQIPQFQYPEDVLHPGDEISRQWLNNNEKESDYIEVIVAEVYDPSKFWIQLRGPHTSSALSSLMDDMQLFYVNNGSSLRLSLLSTRIGLYCAAIFMNEYHRAVIIKIFDDETMKVFYIDYGTIAEVQVRKTCFLHHDFARLPAQAVRARLANIIPVEQNTMWPREATRCMMRLIMEKDLIAFISSIDRQQQILDLIITDTSIPDVDIHINDVLINEGYAVVGKEAPLCATSTATVPNVHLFPTFSEIEHCVYPNIGDVVRLLKLGQTYQQIFRGYFMPTTDTLAIYSPSLDFNVSRCSTSNEHNHYANYSSTPTVGPYDNTEYLDNNEYVNYIDSANEVHTASAINETTNTNNETTNNYEITDNIEKYITCDSDNIAQTESPHTPQEAAAATLTTPENNQEYHPSQETESESLKGISFNVEYSLEQSSPKHDENTTEDDQQSGEKQETASANVKKPPPGFENVKPTKNIEENILLKLCQGSNVQSAPPVQSTPYLAQSVGLLGLPTPLNYTMFSQPALGYNSSLYGLDVYNNYVLNQYLLQQQQQEYLCNLVQQCQMLQEAQRLAALQNQHTWKRNTTFNNDSNNRGTNATSTYSDVKKADGQNKQENDVSSYNAEKENLTTENTCENTSTDSSLKNNKNCDRFVIEFKIGDNIIHILNINDELYVVSQEILKNLLKTSLSLKSWLTAKDVNINIFPNKLVNIMEYEHVYKQMKSFSIPGVYPPNNLGCNIRLTLLNDVDSIIEKYGDQTMLKDLSAGMEYVRSPELWKSLNSSD